MKKIKLILAVLTIGVCLSACGKDVQPTETDIVNNFKESEVSKENVTEHSDENTDYVTSTAIENVTAESSKENVTEPSDENTDYVTSTATDDALSGLSLDYYLDSIGAYYYTGYDIIENRNVKGKMCILDFLNVDSDDEDYSVDDLLAQLYTTVFSYQINVDMTFIDEDNLSVELVNDNNIIKYCLYDSKVYLYYKIGNEEKNVYAEYSNQNSNYMFNEIEMFPYSLLEIDSGIIYDYTEAVLNDNTYKLLDAKGNMKIYVNQKTNNVDKLHVGKTDLDITSVNGIELDNVFNSAEKKSDKDVTDEISYCFERFMEMIYIKIS